MKKQALNGVARLDEMRSASVPQLSSIELVFERGTDLLRARRHRVDADDRLDLRVGLQEGGQPPPEVAGDTGHQDDAPAAAE